MADDSSSNLFGLDDVDDSTLASLIPDATTSASSSGRLATVDIKSSPSDEIDLSGDDPFFTSSAWDFQSTPPYEYDGASTTAPSQPAYLAASWPPLPDFDPSQLDALDSPNVDPASLFGGPPPPAASNPTPRPRNDRGARATTLGVPRAMTTLTPAVQEQLRNIAMPPHLQYHSPKSASSPESATGDGKGRSSSDSGDASKSKKRKVSADADLDDDEEEDEDGKPVKKTSHNMIEKRYRTNLNDKIAALRDSVPSLRIMSKSARGEDTTEDREELHGLTPAHKLNKATVLSKATEYIRHLEKRNGRLMDQTSAMQARIAAFEKLFMAGAMNGSISPMQHQQPPTPMQYSRENGQQYNNSPLTTPGEEGSAAGLIQVPDDMKRILSAQMAVGQPYPVPQQPFRASNPTFVRQQQIQQQQQGQQNGWGNATPYLGKLMVGSLAGLMILEAVREDETSNEEPQGRGLFALPVHLLGYLASGLDLHLMGFHVHTSLKLLLLLGTFLWVFVPSLFTHNKAKAEKTPLAALQPAPSLASSIQVRRQAWLTAIQTVWVPRHNFILEAAALIAKTAKLSLRNAVGAHEYQSLTGAGEEQEAGRVKAWSIALDSQLTGGDVEINMSRLTLTLLASGTLPDTPSRLMLKALHIRVLLWEVSSTRLHLGAVNTIAAKLARSRWNQARQLNQLLVHLRRGSGEQHDDELPPHLATLVEQECDDVFTPDVIQRAYNLAFNEETTHDVETHIDGMDAVVCDTAVASPMDAVAAWSSTQTLHRVLEGALNRDEHALKTRTQELDLAMKVAPDGSVAQARATVARAVLLDEARGKNIGLALKTVESLGSDAMESPLSLSTMPVVDHASGVDLLLSLGCATSIAHLRRADSPMDVPEKETRLIDTVITPATVSSMSLLRCAAAMELMETYLANNGAAEIFGSSLERLAGALRLWMGGPSGNQCGVSAEVRHSVVDRCLTITKSLVGMEMDTGYGSMSECEDE